MMLDTAGNPVRMFTAILMAIFAFIVIISVSAPAAAQNTTYDRFSSGNWNGGASKRNSTGKFEYCFISTGYTDGATITFGIFANGKLGLVVGKKEWNLGKDSRFRVRVWSDRHYLGRFNAKVTSGQNFLVDFGDTSAKAITRFRRGRILKVRTPVHNLSYRLSGTNRALTKTRQCVTRNTGGGGSAGTGGGSGGGDVGADGGGGHGSGNGSGGGSGVTRDEQPSGKTTKTEKAPPPPKDVKSNRATKKEMEQ